MTEDFQQRFATIQRHEVERSLGKEVLSPDDLLILLSPAAQDLLEPLAQRALGVTRRNFGRTIGVYAPLYLSDFCENHCLYCGFRAENPRSRRKLTVDELSSTADVLAGQGIREVLILTGDARSETPWDYLEASLRLLVAKFSSVGIEMFAMSEREYGQVVEWGVDSLTIYQETYDRECYAQVHRGGPKRDFAFRLEAPERGARAGFRAINLGALLGLTEPRSEAYRCAMHALSLQRKFPAVQWGLSLPRLTTAASCNFQSYPIADELFVQIMLAWRVFLPRCGISLSTREPNWMRDNLLGLGVTRISAGSQTSVGGYLRQSDNDGQFSLHDHREISVVVDNIHMKGFDPVFKDWERP